MTNHHLHVSWIERVFVLLVLSLVSAAKTSASSIELNGDNFDKLTTEKNVFIMFYESSCPHCQQLLPEWEKMANDWVAHDIVLIGKVNCRADKATERFCTKEMKIEGLPTMLFGEPSFFGEFLESYGDDKDYTSLTNFVKESLAPKAICSAGRVEACPPEQKEMLESYWKLSVSELAGMVDEKKQEIEQVAQQFRSDFDRMQSEYDANSTEHEAYKARTKANIKMIQSVQAYKKNQPSVTL